MNLEKGNQNQLKIAGTSTYTLSGFGTIPSENIIQRNLNKPQNSYCSPQQPSSKRSSLFLVLGAHGLPAIQKVGQHKGRYTITAVLETILLKFLQTQKEINGSATPE